MAISNAVEGDAKFGYVRLYINETGALHEWRMAGIDKRVSDAGEPLSDEWRENSLTLALNLVEILSDAIDGARMRGRCVEISVKDGPTAYFV